MHAVNEFCYVLYGGCGIVILLSLGSVITFIVLFVIHLQVTINKGNITFVHVYMYIV